MIGCCLLLLLAQAEAPQEKEDRLVVAASLGATTTLSSDSGTGVKPSGHLDISGPIVLGSSSPLSFYGDLAITALPGQTVDFTKLETFHAAELSIGLAKQLGRRQVGSQEITTSVVAEWGFASRIEGAAAGRLSRHYGGGFELRERSSSAFIRLLYGRDEAAGDRGWGQWIISGQVPVGKTDGILSIRGDASLSVGKRRVPQLRQRDIFHLGVFLNIGKVLEKIL